MRILAVGKTPYGTYVTDTTTGEVHPLTDLPKLIVQGEGGVLAGVHLYTYVAALHSKFQAFPAWTLQIRGRERLLRRQDRKVTVGSFLPLYFGFSSSGRHAGNYKGVHRSRAKARLFHCMDLEDIAGLKTTPDMDTVLTHAQSILDLCAKRGVKFTGSRGGVAARLLKASPHWERGRRAAPEFINEIARDKLPGNYYGLAEGAKGRKIAKAVYLDQVASHHSIAQRIDIPHPEHLHARGHYKAALKGQHPAWLIGPAMQDFLATNHGLVAAYVTVPNVRAERHLLPPILSTPGRRLVFLYTNELPYFDTMPLARIEHLVAAWTAPAADPAIKEYASFALQERNAAPGRKALLLAAYGALAQRTDRKSTIYYKYRDKGQSAYLPGAGRVREVQRERRPNTPQPSIVNVIARGMIEAETRIRSLDYARELRSYGVEVPSVYVDGLIVVGDLPLPRPGWSVEAELTNVVFRHPSTWTSDQLSKEPGIPKPDTDGQKAARMMKAAAGRDRVKRTNRPPKGPDRRL